jgi:hypothetical protein
MLTPRPSTTAGDQILLAVLQRTAYFRIEILEEDGPRSVPGASTSLWTSEYSREEQKPVTPAIAKVPSIWVATMLSILSHALLKPVNSPLESRKAGKRDDTRTSEAI